jgi:hypothetical protein
MREEIKSNLKDWMTATSQLEKAKNHNMTSSDISYLWRKIFGIKMTDKWIEKALYGNKSNKGNR